MTREILRKTLVAIIAITVSALTASAQFKTEAFSQDYSNGQEQTDTSEQKPFFSIKEYWGGLRHKNEIDMTTTFTGSLVLVGGEQIYNKQYWKLPLIYTGFLGGIGGGIYFKHKYDASVTAYNEAYEADPTTTLTIDSQSKTMYTAMFAAAGVAYWGALLDGAVCFKTDNPHNPGKALVYGLLCPGLGQIYNGEYWKIPIYWGGLLGSYHFYKLNKTNYDRFRRIYNESNDSSSGYTGTITSSTALYYRNLYRRYRDYSTLAIVAFYFLQAIDANVFSYMQDFEVNDDLSMHMEPTLIAPDTQLAMGGGGWCPAVGMSFGLNF